MCMSTSCEYTRNVGQNRNMKIGTEFCENVAKFIYFGRILTNENYMHEESESIYNSGNACFQLVQYSLCSCLIPKI